MSAYVTRRILTSIPTLLVIVTVAFFMIRIAPAARSIASARCRRRSRSTCSRRTTSISRSRNTPTTCSASSGDFGPSFKYRDFTVAELLWTGFPASLKVGGIAIVLAVLLGITLGTLAALRQNTAFDYAVMATAMTGIAVPNFVMAPLLTLIFGVWLSWLPVAGWNGGAPRNLVLPVIALALLRSPTSRADARQHDRSAAREFVRTARAKGLRERIVVVRHALKGALLPVVSYLGPATAQVVTGSVVIETIFGIPGIGRYFIQGALNRDYTLVMGTVIIYGVLIILLNLLVDLLYGLLDPKVKQR